MGSSCSSVKRKDRQKTHRSSSADAGPHVDLCGQRRCSERSIESLPYGAKSSPPSTSKSSQQQEVSATSRSNEDGRHPASDSHASILDSSRTSKDDNLLAVSSVSPLPASPTVSPFNTPVGNKQSSPISNLSAFPTQIRNLLLGQKVDDISLPATNQLIVFLCCDHTDENFKIVESSFSFLKILCDEKGLELFVVDNCHSNYLTSLRGNYEEDICLQALKSLNNSNAIVLNLFVEEANEHRLLPATISKEDFDTISGYVKSDSKNLLSKWYNVDTNSLQPMFVLRDASKIFADFFSQNPEKRREAFDLWSKEVIEVWELLASCAMDESLRNKYLVSIQQQQINFVLENESAVKQTMLIKFESANKQTSEELQKLVKQLPDHQTAVVSTASEETIQVGVEAIKLMFRKTVESMIEVQSQEESQSVYLGIESSLYKELIEQERIRCDVTSTLVVFESLLKKIELFISSPSNSTLVVYGPRGCGKSSFIAKVSRFVSSNFPSFVVIHRSVGVSEFSLTQEQLFRSIYEQCCTLFGKYMEYARFHATESFVSTLKKITDDKQLLILIDGIDQFAPFHEFDCARFSQQLSSNIKAVFTVTADSPLCTDFENIFGKLNMVEIPVLSVEENFDIFTQILNKKKRKISDAQKQAVAIAFQNCHSPVYAHLLANEAVYWCSDHLNNDSVIPKDASSLMNDVFNYVEHLLGINTAHFLFSLLSVTKHGLTDSQLIHLLSCENALRNSFFSTCKFPCIYWFWIKYRFSYLFREKLVGSIFVNCWRTSFFKQTIVERISHETLVASREMVHTFFKRAVDFDEVFEKAVNIIAAEEAPFAALMSNQSSIANEYIFHLNWLCYKLKTSDPFHFLEDIELFERLYITEEDVELKMLKNFIIVSSYSLRYDFSQIYSQVFARLSEFMSNQSNEVISKYPKMKRIFDYCCDQPKASLFPLYVNFMSLTYDENGSPLGSFRENTDETFCFLFVIKANPVYIVSLSSDSGKIVVWDIYQEKPVRTLKGINQPRNMQMIDEFRALVLCNRELKVYNLDSGVVESKLKGVMNQKMPFYGLHNDHYVVALSRNRMYVNMMNVVTGDLETQFKVGEDRFLNSLLVSANGKICVCGDETQKPFPLLVWDLSSRKLLYDLRIPHHEFITHLAAISDDGHYVVSVCKELSSTAVNFIIVYDLQSGTLFKKWKPECNTCSIAISSQGGFVLNGIENCRILVWDLSTGAKRHNLIGHKAPVDILQIDLSGKRCLSFDSFAKDPSIRIWDAESGTCVAVFTPDHPLSCCQLTPDGQIVVFCFKKCTKLHTLMLCTCKSLENERKFETKTYGQIDLNGSVFDLNES